MSIAFCAWKFHNEEYLVTILGRISSEYSTLRTPTLNYSRPTIVLDKRGSGIERWLSTVSKLNGFTSFVFAPLEDRHNEGHENFLELTYSIKGFQCYHYQPSYPLDALMFSKGVGCDEDYLKIYTVFTPRPSETISMLHSLVARFFVNSVVALLDDPFPAVYKLLLSYNNASLSAGSFLAVYEEERLMNLIIKECRDHSLTKILGKIEQTKQTHYPIEYSSRVIPPLSTSSRDSTTDLPHTLNKVAMNELVRPQPFLISQSSNSESGTPTSGALSQEKHSDQSDLVSPFSLLSLGKPSLQQENTQSFISSPQVANSRTQSTTLYARPSGGTTLINAVASGGAPPQSLTSTLVTTSSGGGSISNGNGTDRGHAQTGGIPLVGNTFTQTATGTTSTANGTLSHLVSATDIITRSSLTTQQQPTTSSSSTTTTGTTDNSSQQNKQQSTTGSNGDNSKIQQSTTNNTQQTTIRSGIASPDQNYSQNHSSEKSERSLRETFSTHCEMYDAVSDYIGFNMEDLSLLAQNVTLEVEDVASFINFAVGQGWFNLVKNPQNDKLGRYLTLPRLNPTHQKPPNIFTAIIKSQPEGTDDVAAIMKIVCSIIWFLVLFHRDKNHIHTNEVIDVSAVISLLHIYAMNVRQDNIAFYAKNRGIISKHALFASDWDCTGLGPSETVEKVKDYCRIITLAFSQLGAEHQYLVSLMRKTFAKYSTTGNKRTDCAMCVLRIFNQLTSLNCPLS